MRTESSRALARALRALRPSAALLACCALLHAAPLLAQSRTGGLFGSSPLQNPLDAARERFGQAAAAGAVPMEGPLDPNEYLVGPSDVFNVAVGGALPLQLPSVVTPDGFLLLPDAQRVRVAGLTLAEAQREAERRLQETYRNVRVEVTLAQPRQFYVHVIGHVPVPGRHLAPPLARVEDVLRLAFAADTAAALPSGDYQPSLRTIVVRHRDGTEESPDLLRYYATGDTGFNPHLRDGDVVLVPAARRTRDVVYVDGEVASPGAYVYRPGDTALDLLLIAAGPRGVPSLGEVRLTRRQADGSVRSVLLDAAALLADPSQAARLEPLDHLHVPRAETRMGSATVEGEARFPGTYPIETGRTTLRELVARAGGLEPGALVRAAYLVRDEAAPLPPAEALRAIAGAAGQAEDPELLRQIRLSELDFFSRTYLLRELRAESRVALDLEAALAPGAPEVPLQHGDRLVIPRDEGTVLVVGQVARPGYVAYRPGAEATGYLEAAGGAGPGATDRFVLEAGTGRWIPAAGATIRSGDVLFVSRAPRADTQELQQIALQQENLEVQREGVELQRRSLRQQNRSVYIQVFLTLIGTAAGIATALILADSRRP